MPITPEPVGVLITPENVAVLHALADPVRLSILDQLSVAPSGVTDLSRTLPITRQGTAKHLAVLRDAGLVRAVGAGRETLYRVSTGPLTEVADSLAAAAGAWGRQLALLKDAAESADL